MADLSSKVISTKTALMAALGDNASKYLANMKLWFQYKLTKEEFDMESRKFLTPELMHLHNQFFIAMLNKIDAFQMPPPPPPPRTAEDSSDASGSSKGRKRKHSDNDDCFQPFDILDEMDEAKVEYIQPPSNNFSNMQMLPTQRYCVQEMFLPDAGFMLGRFLIGAWEAGLENVDDAVAEYMVQAVQTFLKDIISAVIMKVKHYKVTPDRSFYYDVGAPLRDPSLRNTLTRQKLDLTPLYLDKRITSPSSNQKKNDEVAFLSACEEVNIPRNIIIGLKDLQVVLKNRNLIGSHSILSNNSERITQMLP